jgi:hypothetical protein
VASHTSIFKPVRSAMISLHILSQDFEAANGSLKAYRQAMSLRMNLSFRTLFRVSWSCEVRVFFQPAISIALAIRPL